MSGHTPGPWFAVEIELDSDEPHCFTVKFHCDRSKPSGMAEARASATLAASAPELLEAAIEWFSDPLGDPEPMRKAIARAKGEA